MSWRAWGALSAALLAIPAAAPAGDQPDLSGVFQGLSGAARQTGRGLRESQAAAFLKQQADPVEEAIEALKRVRAFDPDRATDEEVLESLRRTGHALERHGPLVTDGFLRDRNIPIATRFESRELMVRAAREAWRAAESELRTNPSFRKELGRLLGGSSRDLAFNYFMRDPMGRGLKRRDGAFEGLKDIPEITVVLRNTQGTVGIYTLFPQGH